MPATSDKTAERKTAFILPIAGVAQRFKDVGIHTPKPMIEAKGRTILEWSLDSLDLKSADYLIFITNQEENDAYGMSDWLYEKYGNKAMVLSLHKRTRGALETCLYATMPIPEISIAIFTPDAIFSPAFSFDHAMTDWDGMLTVYESQSPSCSYARIHKNKVTQVAEKKVISKLATTGLYYFRYAAYFNHYAQDMIKHGETVRGEYYIAPVYNQMIKDNLFVGYQKANCVDVLGTPEELESWKSS